VNSLTELCWICNLYIVFCILFVICDLCIVNFPSLLSVVEFSQKHTFKKEVG
jgi:hypothetical protein